MKKLLFIILAFAPFLCYPQQALVQRTKSNLEDFSEKAGTMIKKEFVSLGKIKNVEFQILRITDLTSNKVISGLRIVGPGKATYSSDHIAFLDADEIDAFLKSIDYVINTVLLANVPDNYVEFNFRSRSGFSAGAFNYKNKWNTYIQLEQYSSDSNYGFGPEEFPQMKEIVQAAKLKL